MRLGDLKVVYREIVSQDILLTIEANRTGTLPFVSNMSTYHTINGEKYRGTVTEINYNIDTDEFGCEYADVEYVVDLNKI